MCLLTPPSATFKSVGVIGAGTMGGGISMNFLNAGIPVTILETKQEALDRGIAIDQARTTKPRSRRASSRKPSTHERMALLSTTLSYDDLKDCGPHHRSRVRRNGRQTEGVRSSSTL
jgi:3-hydroxyacyl-CoA dehydrogenase